MPLPMPPAQSVGHVTPRSARTQPASTSSPSRTQLTPRNARSTQRRPPPELTPRSRERAKADGPGADAPMMPRAADSHAATDTALQVAVRLRPMLSSPGEDIVEDAEGRMVVVCDPEPNKNYLDEVQLRSKERRYTFDVVLGKESTNKQVFETTTQHLAEGVVQGWTATVFAYGATGSGKTHTMLGTPHDPGLMMRAIELIFQKLRSYDSDYSSVVKLAYLEVYNELIYDLTVPRSPVLDLREDPHGGVRVAGLRTITVTNMTDVRKILEEGNRRRKTEATRANVTSSRSHAVLEVCVTHTENAALLGKKIEAKLSLVDLAGSERASETNNNGQQLRDGANINKSLLALANCINALGKGKSTVTGRPLAYIPFRNSKLTRLLKEGLSGNCSTCMLATVSCASGGYYNTINTLKYADRAKEIKTQVHHNAKTVEAHVLEYQQIISDLQMQVASLKLELHSSTKKPIGQHALPDPAADDDWQALQTLLEEMSSNAEERVNVQQALFEVESQNEANLWQIEQLEDQLQKSDQLSAGDRAKLHASYAETMEAVSANEESRMSLMEDLRSNEADRLSLQERLEMDSQRPQSRKHKILTMQQRIQHSKEVELKFQLAIRDQLIYEQRAAMAVAWSLFDQMGMSSEHVIAAARQAGVAGAEKATRIMEDAARAPHASSVINHNSSNRFSSVLAKYNVRQSNPTGGSNPHHQQQQRRQTPLSRGETLLAATTVANMPSPTRRGIAAAAGRWTRSMYSKLFKASRRSTSKKADKYRVEDPAPTN